MASPGSQLADSVTFRNWYGWMASLPWSKRWFVLLILFRPVIDGLYFVKDISPLLSPCYLVGALTPIIIVSLFVARRLAKRNSVLQDAVFCALGVISAVNAIMVMATEVSLRTLEVALKLPLPCLIYLFSRHFVRSRSDIVGIITTFLYSTVFAFGSLIYENIYSPIASPDTARGLTRLHGFFSDAVSYSLYSTGALFCAGFLVLLPSRQGGSQRKLKQLLIVSLFCVLSMMSIQHAASWAITCVILVMLMLSGVARSLFIPTAILGVAVMGYALFGDAVRDRIASVYASEVKVLTGQEDSDRGFHGRMYIWKSYLRRWRDTSLLTKLVGISAADQEELAPTPYGQVQVMRNMVLAGIHSDFLRIMFSAGLVGLTLYFLFFVLVIVSGMGANVAERFLIITAAAIVLLYSVTTLPTLYAPCLYLYMPVFAYAARLRENGIARRSLRLPTGSLSAVTHRA